MQTYRVERVYRDMYELGAITDTMTPPLTYSMAIQYMEKVERRERAECSKALPVVSVSGEPCTDAFYSVSGDSFCFYRIVKEEHTPC